MIKVTIEKWNRISRDFKGIWSRSDNPELIGRKTVLSGCISEEKGSLFIEGVHFEIVQ